MAGVGFSLRALDRHTSCAARVWVYGAAAAISSGPWLLSIGTLLALGAWGRARGAEPLLLARLQVAITWTFAGSLIAAGPLQLMLTRFAADREYAGERTRIAPNLLGAVVCMSALGALLWFVGCELVVGFGSEPFALRALLAIAFITLCDVWLVVGVLTGLREHRPVLASFALGYAVTGVAALGGAAAHGELGALAGFVLGQASLLFCALYVLLSRASGPLRIEFSFLRRGAMFPALGWTGLLYNLGIWADKFVFWSAPELSGPVLGPLRASEVYDLPVFVAYLSIVPGMAVFLLRAETDFAQAHQQFYAAVRGGAGLRSLERSSDRLTEAARGGLAAIGRVQAGTFLLCAWLAPQLLAAFGISPLHAALFRIAAFGVALQVLLVAVINALFYLDLRGRVAALAVLLLACNVLLSWWSQRLGPRYYGCGFAAAMAITSLVGLVWLDASLRRLVRDTFMGQPVVS